MFDDESVIIDAPQATPSLTAQDIRAELAGAGVRASRVSTPHASDNTGIDLNGHRLLDQALARRILSALSGEQQDPGQTNVFVLAQDSQMR